MSATTRWIANLRSVSPDGRTSPFVTVDATGMSASHDESWTTTDSQWDSGYPGNGTTPTYHTIFQGGIRQLT